MLTRLAKVQPLIIDDLVLTRREEPKRNDRREIFATVTTNFPPFKDWHPIIGDPTVADAVLDRLLRHSCKIELKGVSIRKTKE